MNTHHQAMRRDYNAALDYDKKVGVGMWQHKVEAGQIRGEAEYVRNL